MDPLKIGIVGCGVISDAYLKGAQGSNIISVKSVADKRPEAASEKAETYGLEATTLDAMLDDPEIGIILNLTIPAAHTRINRSVATAGKHVYSEKPFGITFAEAKAVMDTAEAAGVRVGGAPDTFLGAGHQTVRRLVDEGAIGTVTGGSATFATPGPDVWHPNPFFFFERGGGPVLDIGCYPITQLVNCLGPVSAVVADATRPRPVRAIGSGPRAGEDITVDVWTTVNGALSFANGASVSFTASWDVWRHSRPPIELYGTEGTIENPDPNFFGGPVRLSRRGSDWEEVAVDALPFGTPNRLTRRGQNVADYRMVGLLDMAAAIREGRPHRASGTLALHVLEVMEAMEVAAADGRRVALTTTCERPAPVPNGTNEAVFFAAA